MHHRQALHAALPAEICCRFMFCGQTIDKAPHGARSAHCRKILRFAFGSPPAIQQDFEKAPYAGCLSAVLPVATPATATTMHFAGTIDAHQPMSTPALNAAIPGGTVFQGSSSYERRAPP